MLIQINPKLPMQNKGVMKDFYLRKLGFSEFGTADFDGYLMPQMHNIQIHFLSLTN